MANWSTRRAFDRLLGTRFGAAAVKWLLAGESGKMTCLEADQIVPKDIKVAIETPPSLREDILRQLEPLSM